jgi:hypothetical protein
MDQSILVRSGKLLVEGLDHAGDRPRAAVWVHNGETDTWKLWIVLQPSASDQREFYRRVSEIVAKNRDQLGGIDASDVELVSESHPAIRGLAAMMRVEGLSDVHLSNNRLNGFYLPDGIILRLAL